MGTVTLLMETAGVRFRSRGCRILVTDNKLGLKDFRLRGTAALTTGTLGVGF